MPNDLNYGQSRCLPKHTWILTWKGRANYSISFCSVWIGDSSLAIVHRGRIIPGKGTPLPVLQQPIQEGTLENTHPQAPNLPLNCRGLWLFGRRSCTSLCLLHFLHELRFRAGSICLCISCLPLIVLTLIKTPEYFEHSLCLTLCSLLYHCFLIQPLQQA